MYSFGIRIVCIWFVRYGLQWLLVGSRSGWHVTRCVRKACKQQYICKRVITFLLFWLITIFSSDWFLKFSVSNELKAIESQGDLDVDAFKQFSKTHKALLFPAFLVQESLQRRILGKSFWERHSNRRIEISKGQFIPIAKFMEIVSET